MWRCYSPHMRCWLTRVSTWTAWSLVIVNLSIGMPFACPIRSRNSTADCSWVLSSSSAILCVESSNVAAVATYKSAGFQQLPEVQDLHGSA